MSLFPQGSAPFIPLHVDCDFVSQQSDLSNEDNLLDLYKTFTALCHCIVFGYLRKQMQRKEMICSAELHSK